MDKDRPQVNDPRFVLKATPPRVPKNLLLRQRLQLRGEGLADKSAVALYASSGFGKTSLLAQWRRETLEAGGLVAWLSLDERDDDTRFTQGLVVAMQLGSGRFRFGQSYVPKSAEVTAQHERITGWLAEIIELAAEVVLILDDVHLLPHETIQNSLLYLLRNAPPNLRIVFASRLPLDLAVSELIARGDFVQLSSDSLRLQLAETTAILNARFSTRIDSDSCVRLHELTEGWPIGLQLVISTLEKSSDISEAIAKCLYHSGDIFRRLIEPLIESLPRPMVQFLIHVVFVDSLHPGLCRAITQTGDSADILSYLSQATPIFVESSNSTWLRLHPLAYDYLMESFEALPADEKRLLRGRAAQWLADNGFYEEAGRHALDAGQHEMAYELAGRCLFDVLASGEIARVAQWMERIPAHEIQARPWLRLAVGWTLAQSKQHEEAAKLVGPLIDDMTVSDKIRRESAEICGTAAFFADDIASMERILTPWLDTLTKTQSKNQSHLNVVGINMQAALSIARGDPERARYYCLQVTTEDESKRAYALGWTDCMIGKAYWWSGQIMLAEEFLRTALNRAEQRCGRRSPIAAMQAALLSAALWEGNRIGEISDLLANRLDVLEKYGAPDAIAMGYVTAARVAEHDGQTKRSRDILDSLFVLGKNRNLPRLCIMSLCEQIRTQALLGNKTVCKALVNMFDDLITVEQAKSWGRLQSLVTMQMGLARAFSFAAQQDWERVQSELQAVDPIAESLQRQRDRVQISLLQALALRRRGKDAQALFQEALDSAQRLGLARILKDTHPDLLDWQSQQQKTPPLPVPVVRASTATRDMPARIAPSTLLTPKEREILRLLVSNYRMSNKEIAVVLDAGTETIKWHLKNLFSKLSAANRKHLVDRSRMLGLVE